MADDRAKLFEFSAAVCDLTVFGFAGIGFTVVEAVGFSTCLGSPQFKVYPQWNSQSSALRVVVAV
jgi:hypothetical protein